MVAEDWKGIYLTLQSIRRMSAGNAAPAPRATGTVISKFESRFIGDWWLKGLAFVIEWGMDE